MLIIVGGVAVFLCVFGAFAIGGGELDVLWQPIEMVIIFGAAAGSLLISSPISLLKAIVAQSLGALKGHSPTKETFMEVLLLMYELFKTGKGNMLGLEEHVENPEKSSIFSKYPHVLHNHHAIKFICDTLRVQISSPVSPYDLEDLMDADIASVHNEELKIPETVGRIGDAMPGLGIVAAVLGVVHTMGKLTEGKEVIGHSVAAALVGTFLGILISYGFVGPFSAKLKENIDAEGKVMTVIKQALLAFAKDISPKICVEVARRTIPVDLRPDFKEVDAATANVKTAGKAA